MCILCFVHKCTRRVATMLPWLLLPLGILWALSQLLPPGLRFEIGSPQLACVSVLLLTVFWYEFLGPRLSVWRARREDRLRERRHIEAIELQKLRKSALRRCRNCHSPYRDQNPGGGGRFMCSNCGHVSKRPVLEIPKAGSGSGVIFGKDECWAHSAPGDDDERCSAERSYSGVFVLVCRVLSWILSRMRLVWRKAFRGSSRADLDRERNGSSSRRGEGGGDCQESKGEKARRKAEERRQARLEKEMLEEEERKQREEVARLVEERRRLRDEKLEAEKKHSTSQGFGGESGVKEGERRRLEKGKEKEKEKDTHGEELEKSAVKKIESERYDSLRATAVNQKSSASEPVHGNKSMANKKRYFDTMKGSFLSSPRSFNSATLFGKNAQNPVASATRASKPAVAFVDHKLGHGSASDTHSTGHGVARLTQGNNQSLGPDAQPRATSPKKSWHQLFACASPVLSNLDSHTDFSSTTNYQLEVHSTESIDHAPPHDASSENQIAQSLTSTIHASSDGLFDCNLTAHTADESMYPPLVAESVRVSTIRASSDGLFDSNLTAHTAAESVYPSLVAESGHVSVSEDVELFEDPCYIPEPTPLFGPVSPDDFPLEFGAGFVMEGHHVLKNVGASGDVSKPSPIEPPMSRLRGHEEKHTASNQAVCGPKSQKANSSNFDDSSKAHEPGMWQMWGTPVVQDAITEIVGRPSGWSFPIGLKESIQESVLPPPQSNMIPKPAKENPDVPAVFSPERVPGIDPQNVGLFGPLGIGLNDSAPSIHNPLPHPLPVDGGSPFLPHDLIDNIARNEVMYGIPDSSAAGLPFELSPANPWSKGNWIMQNPEDARAQFPDVPSPMWAYN